MSKKILLQKKVQIDTPTLSYQFNSKKDISKNLNFLAMKKLITILLIAFVTSMGITACTEEEVIPTAPVFAGKPSDPMKK